jgi:putative redox protein
MKIIVDRKNTGFHFTAKNESGNLVEMDANPSMGGEGKGARPMELLIMGLGGCSGIDIVNILNKQKLTLDDLRIEIDAQREEGKVPSLFEKIEVIFFLHGNIPPAKAKRAVDLSMEKYCSVTATLQKTAIITWKVELNGTSI